MKKSKELNFRLLALSLFASVLTMSLTVSRASAEPAATHGMLVFGKNATYLSHLPMFHSPHDIQWVAQVAMKSSDNDRAFEKYQVLLDQGETLFTLEPQPFQLSQALTEQGLAPFQGVLYKGHFESNGIPLGKVKVTVTKPLIAVPLDPNAFEEESYILFGQKGEYYAAHRIKGKPNFDLILQVTQPQILKPFKCPTRLCGKFSVVPLLDEDLPVFLNGAGQPNSGTVLSSLDGVISGVIKQIYLQIDELTH